MNLETAIANRIMEKFPQIKHGVSFHASLPECAESEWKYVRNLVAEEVRSILANNGRSERGRTT